MAGNCTTISPQLAATDATGASSIATINTIIAALQSNSMVTLPALAIGSTPANAANVLTIYKIGGIQYSKAAVAAGTALGNDIVPTGTFGAVALDVDAAGTITAIEAAANATGYASAALAIAGIPVSLAATARLGTVTATKSDGAFTFGTTSLAAANSTVVYTDGTTAIEDLSAIS